MEVEEEAEASPLPLNSASSPEILFSAVTHRMSQPSRSVRSRTDTVATVKVDSALGDDDDADEDGDGDDESEDEAAFFPPAAADAFESVFESVKDDDDDDDDDDEAEAEAEAEAAAAVLVPAAAAPPTNSFHTALGQSRLSACLPRIDMPNSLPTNAYMLRCNCARAGKRRRKNRLK